MWVTSVARRLAAAAAPRGQALRGFVASGLSDIEPALLAKARKMALAVGGAAGVFGSLVGVGGGVLIAPVIVNACPSIPQRIISGTSLAAVAATGTTAGAVYWGAGQVDVKSAALLTLSAMITAPLGARATHRVDCHALRRALGYWLYAVAPLVPIKAAIFASNGDAASASYTPEGPAHPAAAAALPPAAAAPAATPPGGSQLPAAAPPGAYERVSDFVRGLGPADAAIAATGCLAGFASGLLGIGGGTVVTPLLALFSGLPQPAVLGTSLVSMVAPSLVGLAQHQRLGNVDWRMAAALAAGTASGGWLGSCFAVKAPPGLLEAAFAVGMLVLGRGTLRAAAAAAKKAALAAK